VHGAAFDRLAAGIRRREGILVLTGEVGTGKTTLCRAMFQSLDQKTFAAFVPDPFLSREDLLKTLLVDFGVVSADEIRTGRLRGVSRTDLSYPLYDFLASLQPLKAFAVVMIDEAQNLTTELLEEIRILSDLENRQKLLQVLLVGQPELQLRLATPAMRQLSQRVSIRCELTPFAREDVKPYVSHRLAIAGNDGRVQFSDAAIDFVGTASNGIPRVINLLCDRALFRAAHSQTLTVDAKHVVWAVDDLKLTVAQTLRTALGDQPATALASFPEEFHDASSAREDRHHPPPQGEGVSSTGPGGQLDEIFGSAFPDAGTAGLNSSGNPPAGTKPAIVGDSAAARRRRNRLLALVGALLAVTTSLAGRWCSSAPASRQQSALQPAEPPRPLLREPPGEAMQLFPAPKSRPTGSPGPSNRTDTNVSPGQTAGRLALQMATFQSPARAAQALQEFRDAGYHAYISEVSLRDGEHAFAVFLGPYADAAPAERDLDRARQMPGYGSGHLVRLDPSLQSPALDP
jgi:general secretion pathway protein A